MRGAVDDDAAAVAFHRQPKSLLQALARDFARDLQFVAIIAHGRAAGAIDDRAFLGDVIHDRGVAALRPALALDGIALEARLLAGA